MESDFFKRVDFQIGELGAGKVLISEPFMFDFNFKRTVIFLVEHNNDGSLGFILNRHTDYKLHDIMPEITNPNIDLFFGGPVGKESLFFIHTLGELIPESLKITDGVYWGGDFETLKTMINLNQIDINEVKFFVGYSGWSPNQLNFEMEEKSWILAKMRDEIIMKGKDKKFWKAALRGMGGEYKVMANFPENPSEN